MRSVLVATLWIAIRLVAGAAAAQATDEALVVYCGRDESLVGPIFTSFTRESGIHLDVRYGSTPTLANRVANEGGNSAAQVIFFEDAGYLGLLAELGYLSTLPDSLLGRVDRRFRDPGGRWIGISGRVRVLVYDPERVSESELPRKLSGLADPRWEKRLGWAPDQPGFTAHIGALHHLWGEEYTRQWLQAVIANEPREYAADAPQVRAVAEGEIDLGWINHDELYRQKALGVAARGYSFPVAGDAGNIMMVAGLAIRRGSPHPELAIELAVFLLQRPVQRRFAVEGFEYPARGDLPASPGLPPLESLHLAEVEQRGLADLGSTLQLLRSVGLE